MKILKLHQIPFNGTKPVAGETYQSRINTLLVHQIADGSNEVDLYYTDDNGKVVEFTKRLTPEDIEDKDWLKVGGEIPKEITDAIFTKGKVGINVENPEYVLDVNNFQADTDDNVTISEVGPLLMGEYESSSTSQTFGIEGYSSIPDEGDFSSLPSKLLKINFKTFTDGSSSNEHGYIVVDNSNNDSFEIGEDNFGGEIFKINNIKQINTDDPEYHHYIDTNGNRVLFKNISVYNPDNERTKLLNLSNKLKVELSNGELPTTTNGKPLFIEDNVVKVGNIDAKLERGSYEGTAQQLAERIQALERLVDATGDDTLDQVSEIVDYIKANRDTLNNLSIDNIIGLKDALNAIDTKFGTKVDKVEGKDLISNDLITKLEGLSNYDDTDLKQNATGINAENWRRELGFDDTYVTGENF